MTASPPSDNGWRPIHDLDQFEAEQVARMIGELDRHISEEPNPVIRALMARDYPAIVEVLRHQVRSQVDKMRAARDATATRH